MTKAQHQSSRAAASARGGSYTAADSPAKARALAKLHSSRRGRRVNIIDPDRLLAVAARITSILSRRESSRRQLANDLDVSDRTVRRWLRCEDHPSPVRLRKLEQWADRHATR